MSEKRERRINAKVKPNTTPTKIDGTAILIAIQAPSNRNGSIT